MTVPAALLQPYVARFVGESSQLNGPLPGLATLAEKTALSYDTIQRVFTREDYHVQFDVADRILCAVQAVDAWYMPPLVDIYLAHSLTEIDPRIDRCHRRGCTKPLPPKKWHGGLPRRFCSKTCQQAASRLRRRGRGRYSNHMDQCKNGHDWSEENTYWWRGMRKCRQCMRDAQKRGRRRRRQQAVAA